MELLMELLALWLHRDHGDHHARLLDLGEQKMQPDWFALRNHLPLASRPRSENKRRMRGRSRRALPTDSLFAPFAFVFVRPLARSLFFAKYSRPRPSRPSPEGGGGVAMVMGSSSVKHCRCEWQNKIPGSERERKSSSLFRDGNILISHHGISL